jgi:phenylacetate-CoA ligase
MLASVTTTPMTTNALDPELARLVELVSDVPYYRDLYGDAFSHLFRRATWSSLPVLEKADVARSFPRRWKSRILEDHLASGRVEYASTSGTSGERLQIVRHPKWWRAEHQRSYPHNEYLRSFSLDTGRRAQLSTAVCSGMACFRELPSYEKRIDDYTLSLNMTPDPNDWTVGDVERFVEELGRYRPDMLDADPIYLVLLTRKMRELGIDIASLRPRFLVLDYELVTGCARRYIERTWQLPIVNLYGTTEVGCLYHEVDGTFRRCPDGTRLDFAPYDGEPDLYWVLVTSWKNELMPFVRLRIGDLVRSRDSRILTDPENARIDRFCGRGADATFRDDGSIVTAGDVDHAISSEESPILVYQVEDGLATGSGLRLRYVTENGAPLEGVTAASIEERLRALYRTDKHVELTSVPSIAPTSSGKFAVARRLQ